MLVCPAAAPMILQPVHTPARHPFSAWQHSQTPRAGAHLRPRLTAIAIVSRLADLHPDQFDKKQPSIVQRLLRALRKNAAQRLIAATAAGEARRSRSHPGLWTARAM